MTKKLVISLAIASAVALTSMPLSFDVGAAGFQETQKREKRPTNLVGPNVGKKVQKAYEFIANDDYAGALQAFLEINTKKEYDTAYVKNFIASLYAQEGDIAKSIKYFEEALAPDILNEPEQERALKTLAQLYMNEKMYEKAIKRYEEWMAFTGKQEADIWVRISSAYAELKQYDKVVAPADNAIAMYKAQGKPNQNPYTLKFLAYYERKLNKDAIKVLEEAVQIFPETKTWWLQLGSFYSLVEDYDKSLYTLELAYKLGYLEKDTQIKMLASLYANTQVPYRAARLIEKHIDSGLIARDDKSVAMLANYWHSAQEIVKAAKLYGELAKLTNNPEHYRKQAGLLLQAEKYSQSIEPFKKALELNVRNPGRVYDSLMQAYFYQGKYKDALAMNAEALKHPKSKRNAAAWTQYIKDTAMRKNVRI